MAMLSPLATTFQALERDLNAQHLERGPVIRGLVCGLLARQHVIILGPPGTGKSRLVRDLTARIGGRYFEWLLTRMSTLEELFGPISLAALEQDHYRRVTTDKLPEADVAYVDETFKGSSAILNSMLGVLNERVFHNNGTPQRVPLQMAVGASNELPEDREELAALWDRFLIRHVVESLRDPHAFASMLQIARTPTPAVTLTLQDLTTAQQDVAQVDLAPAIPTLVALRRALAQQGITASDRRWHDATGVLQAQAWLNGHAAVDSSDLAILADILWDAPEQRAQVAKAVLQLVSPYDQEAQDVLDDALEAYTTAMNAPEEQQTAVGLEANTALKAAAKKLAAIREKATQAGRPSLRAEEGIAQVAQWGQEVLTTCLKVG